MSHAVRNASVLISSIFLLAGCTQEPGERQNVSAEAAVPVDVIASDENENVPQLETNPYSPYGVRILENTHFDVVTFKDVGVSHFSRDREPLLESIADSLAFNMSVDVTLPYRAQLVHSEKYADPDSHLYCEMNHIYVDIWTATAPDRFGYSLWSGCSETDQFAWEELPITLSEGGEYFSAVEALTGRIADRIRDADKSDCFTQTC